MSALHSNSQLLSSFGPVPGGGMEPLRPWLAAAVGVKPFTAVVPLCMPGCMGFKVPPLPPFPKGGSFVDPQSGRYSIPGSNCINTKTCNHKMMLVIWFGVISTLWIPLCGIHSPGYDFKVVGKDLVVRTVLVVRSTLCNAFTKINSFIC